MPDEAMFGPGQAAGAGAGAAGEPPAGPLAFDCPRCGRAAEATYWGPCACCRQDLVASMGREARPVEATAYEPKANVVPNQVATRD